MSFHSGGRIFFSGKDDPAPICGRLIRYTERRFSLRFLFTRIFLLRSVPLSRSTLPLRPIGTFILRGYCFCVLHRSGRGGTLPLPFGIGGRPQGLSQRVTLFFSFSADARFYILHRSGRGGTLPLPLGEVAMRSIDGEGSLFSQKGVRSLGLRRGQLSFSFSADTAFTFYTAQAAEALTLPGAAK